MINEKKEIKEILRNITDSRLFWMVVSFLAAALLWLYVTTTEGVVIPKDLTNVPVVFLGTDTIRESSNLVVTEQDISSVNLTLSGTRRVLSKLNNGNVTAAIDLSRMTSDGRYTVAYEIRYPSGVSTDEITVTRSSADVVTFYLDNLLRKTVEVKGVFSGNTADGYMENSLAFDPLVVAIRGPKVIVDQVDHAFVAITREGVDKTLSYSTTYELRDKDENVVDDSNIVRETSEVKVTLSELSTRSVPLDVTIINGGGAARGDNTTIDIVPSSIVLAGDAEVIDSTSKLILGTVDLASFATDYLATFTIVPPNNTENLTGVSEATVTISIVGLATQSMPISLDNITINIIPEGYKAEIVTQSLNATVRAPEEILAQVESRNIRAVADLSDITNPSPGVYNPTLRIRVDGFPEAGVVGEYRIYITLSAADGT